VKEEITEIRRKYADERRTHIENVSGEVDIEDLIPVEECVITMTHYGYMKRQPMDVYKSQRRGGRGVSGMSRREEDFAEELFVCGSHDYVMFFTTLGRVYRLKGYEIPEGSRNAKGTNVINLLPLQPEEKVSAMIRVPAFEEGKYLVMVTRKGVIKRTEMMAYNTARKGGLIAIDIDEGDELAWVRVTDGNSDLIVATRNGASIRFMETDARPLGRTARGVRAIDLSEDDEVVGMAVVKEGATLLTITEKGLGRRTAVEEYRCQNRGGKGSINYKTDDEKGLVAGVRMVEDNDDAIIITDDGIIIRTPVNQINPTSRYAQGVRVMRLNEGARIVTFSVAPHEEIAGEDAPVEEEAAVETAETEE